MSARKKEFEDSVVIFKQESGQSKGDAWLTYEMKVTGVANNLYPDHAPFIFDQFDDKEQDWSLNSNVFFKELQEKVLQYHPGKKPKAGSYTDVSTGIHRQGEYDSAKRHWQNRCDKFQRNFTRWLKWKRLRITCKRQMVAKRK
jgi:hypothetical protein